MAEVKSEESRINTLQNIDSLFEKALKGDFCAIAEIYKIRECVDSEKFKLFINQLKCNAESSDNPRIMFNYSYCLKYGMGSTVDKELAFVLDKKAAGKVGINEKYQVARQLYDIGAIDTTLILCDELANEPHNDPKAMYSLGTYLSKYGFEAEAFMWFSLASNWHSNLSAMVSCAEYYLNGAGIRKNYGQAIKYYQNAGKEGEDKLAEMSGKIRDGLLACSGIEEITKKVDELVKFNFTAQLPFFLERKVSLITLLTELGYKDFASELLQRNLEIKLKRSSGSSDENQDNKLNTRYKTSDSLNSDIDPSLQETKQDKTTNTISLPICFLQARKNSSDAQICLEYFDQIKMPELTEFISALSEQSNQGNPQAMANYSYCLKYGIGGIKDDDQSLMWLEKAAQEHDCADAIDELAVELNEKGFSAEAFMLLSKEAINNNPYAVCNLAQFYINGNGVRHDYDMAIKLYKYAYEIGSKKKDDYLCLKAQAGLHNMLENILLDIESAHSQKRLPETVKELVYVHNFPLDVALPQEESNKTMNLLPLLRYWGEKDLANEIDARSAKSSDSKNTFNIASKSKKDSWIVIPTIIDEISMAGSGMGARRIV